MKARDLAAALMNAAPDAKCRDQPVPAGDPG
jgi:hypothetical protein